jgi:membrane fusion protein, multidrug efflux system
VEAARAGLAGAKSKYNLVSEGASSEDLDILESTVNAAQATYDLAKLSLGYASVRAPENGTIVQMTAHIGDIVTPGLSAMSIMDLSKLTVTAYVLETDLENVKVGSQVKLSIDSFPGKSFKGTVMEVGEATSSVFSLFSSDNASGNYTKVSQRVPIKVSFNYGNNLVIPGMSTTAKIKITK